MTQKITVFFLLSFIVSVFISACSNNLMVKTAVESVPPARQYVAATQTQATISTMTITPTPRFIPEAWRTWPVVPDVTPRAIEIYKKGRELGNNPRAFSKIEIGRAHV